MLVLLIARSPRYDPVQSEEEISATNGNTHLAHFMLVRATVQYRLIVPRQRPPHRGCGGLFQFPQPLLAPNMCSTTRGVFNLMQYAWKIFSFSILLR